MLGDVLGVCALMGILVFGRAGTVMVRVVVPMIVVVVMVMVVLVLRKRLGRMVVQTGSMQHPQPNAHHDQG